MLERIPFEQLALALPRVAPEGEAPRPYGARSAAAAYVADLLMAEVPGLGNGSLELVSVARRPGVLTKVAIRASVLAWSGVRVGIGADHIARVRHALDGERIHVVGWQRSAPGYIADALGLAEPAPTLLLPGLSHARVLLGDIDLRGLAGWRGINVILASALTGWRIRLDSVAQTAAWTSLNTAMRTRRALEATVIGRRERGMRIEVEGLYALVSDHSAADTWRPGDAVVVRVTRLDRDEGRVFAAPARAHDGQLALAI
jgi:transcription antitermination factor NusA-like protein